MPLFSTFCCTSAALAWWSSKKIKNDCFSLFCGVVSWTRAVADNMKCSDSREWQRTAKWHRVECFVNVLIHCYAGCTTFCLSLYRCGMDIAPNPGLMPKSLDIDNREDSSFLIGSRLNHGFTSWFRTESKSVMVQIRVLSVQQHTILYVRHRHPVLLSGAVCTPSTSIPNQSMNYQWSWMKYLLPMSHQLFCRIYRFTQTTHFEDIPNRKKNGG